MTQTLYIVRGVPGSGKSTIASRIAAMTGSPHFENDMFFMRDGEYRWEGRLVPTAAKWCFDQTVAAMDAGQSVVVSNTFVHLKHLKPYVDEAVKRGILIAVTEAKGSFQNVHSVPDETVERMRKDFQPIPDGFLPDNAVVV